jgi:hypothetical protein
MNRIQQFLDEATGNELRQANSLISARLRDIDSSVVGEKRILMRGIRKLDSILNNTEVSAETVQRYLNLVDCMLRLVEKEVGERNEDTYGNCMCRYISRGVVSNVCGA